MEGREKEEKRVTVLIRQGEARASKVPATNTGVELSFLSHILWLLLHTFMNEVNEQ